MHTNTLAQWRLAIQYFLPMGTVTNDEENNESFKQGV